MRPVVLVLPLLLVAPLAAQQVREVPLGSPTAMHAGEFSLINGIRELRDGSVLVADPIDAVLRRLDRTLSRVDTVGRIGSGPSEYRQPDAVWPLPGDSTLLVDLGNNRLVRLGADMGFGTYRPIMAGGGEPEDIQMMLISGVDGRGRLYFRGMGRPDMDSVPLNRAATDGSKVQQIAKLKGPESKVTSTGGPGNRSTNARTVPLSPVDGWAVSPAGLVYLVRAGDYHVEVMTPTGQVIRGAVVPWKPVRITDADKEEFQDQVQRRGGVTIGVSNQNGQVSFSMRRGAPPRNELDADLPWPVAKPPFDAGDLWVDSQERLWVRRTGPAGAATHYDIFTPNGDRVATVTMTANRKVAGMGSRTVYVIRYDDDDLQHLERYELPL